MWKTVVTPGFGDADPLRHINNCLLPHWFELGRNPVFSLFHPSLEFDSWPLILARISVDYIRQMTFGTDVEIRTFIKKIGRSSFTVYQEAHQKARLGATGDAVLVHDDYRLQKSAPIPENIVKLLEKHLADPDNPTIRARTGRLPQADGSAREKAGR